MMIIRSAQAPGTVTTLRGVPERMQDTDPLKAQAAQAFTVELAPGRVPSVRAMRARLHVGQPRAQRVRAYLAALNGTQTACHSNSRLPRIFEDHGLAGRKTMRFRGRPLDAAERHS